MKIKPQTLFIFLFSFSLAWFVLPHINGYLAARTNPDIIFPDNSRYTGGFKDGLLEGQGSLVFANGSHYTGSFVEGLYQGHGEMVYSTGERYVGEFDKGMEHGEGELTTTGNLHYTGQFTKGLVSGIGKLTFENGDVYEGEVINWRMDGSGKYTAVDGTAYEGFFVNDAFTGEGIVNRVKGDRYEGYFIDWLLEGEGRFEGGDGTRYTGYFKNNMYHGKGELISSNGDVYIGEFENSYKHGKGVLTFAKPEKGVKEQKGKWSYDRYKDPARKLRNKLKREIAEKSLYNQNEILASELSGVPAGIPGDIEMFFLGLGGDGSQQVFKRELAFVYDKVDDVFSVKNRSAMLLNTLYPDNLPLATGHAFQQALMRVAEKMNKNEDILFLYLTSHGTEKHSIYLNQPGISLENLSLSTIKKSLNNSGIKWKVIVVSACYSGGYIDALKDSNTLILTAAAKDRKSFGCSDSSDLTYFAKALFRDSLTDETTFEEAFLNAKALIKEWEVTEKIKESSNPKISMGASIRTYLSQFRQGLKLLKQKSAVMVENH